MGWDIYQAESGAVAINIDFQILECYENGQWNDWRQYEPQTVDGAFYVVKKDGTLNTTVVEQLVASMGWNGSFAAVDKMPPKVIVQLNVKQDNYGDAPRFRASWMNPGDYTPKSSVSPEIVKNLDSRFGSLLRAAASTTKPQVVTANGEDLPF